MSLRLRRAAVAVSAVTAVLAVGTLATSVESTSVQLQSPAQADGLIWD
ncbi:hypothetical protein [Streptomyces sp. NPDC001388]